MIKKTVVAGAVLLLLFCALLAFIVLSDFADIPCQDGIWNDAKHTCIPTPS